MRRISAIDMADLVGQAVWVLPWIWVPLVWQLVIGCKIGLSNHPNNTTDRNKIWFLCCLAVGPILVFSIINLWSHIASYSLGRHPAI